MIINQPSRLSFWRFVLLVSSTLPFLALVESISLARGLEIVIYLRPSWIGLLVVLFLLGLIPLLFFILTWFRFGERVVQTLEFPERFEARFTWLKWLMLIAAIIGYTFIITIPAINKLFHDTNWIRILLFWYFTIIGMMTVKMIWPTTMWFTSMMGVVLGQITFHILAVNFSYITNYPFALGWSETSRYYHPSMFVSRLVYGQRYPFPIINPSLHMLLFPPYLFNLPLAGHRLWLVSLRNIMLAITALVMINRLMAKGTRGRLLVGLWIFLFLVTLPLYFHLALPLILILAGYSSNNHPKTLFVLFLASAWCGMSRVNWYPVPAMIAAVFYVLETPLKNKNLFQYLSKPAFWGVFGMVTAIGFQRLYILISGVKDSNYFYTTFVSDLLWYRLLPNATFPTGILPTLILVSFPIWITIYSVFHSRPRIFHPVRKFLIFAALVALLIVGLIVSVKIGGGADLHNMDAYFVTLLILTGYLVFAKYQREDGQHDLPVPLHWSIVVLLVALPVWSQFHSNVGIKLYDPYRTDSILTTLQERVDLANADGGEILFISQRQLISLGLLHNVNLVPEYEREDLMEMAMGGNTDYLGKFQNDIKNQRFSLIIVDPLKFQYLGSNRSFGEENNVWVRQVIKPILCNYRQEAVFPEDEIALYVPQMGERQCP